MTTMDIACDWIDTTIHALGAATTAESNPETRAGMQDAMAFLAVQFVGTKEAYRITGGFVLGRGYNMVQRIAGASAASASTVRTLEMCDRLGSDYAEGWDTLARKFTTACELWIAENM